MTPHEKAIEIAKEVIEEWTGDFRGEEIILAQAVLEQAAEIKRLRDKYDFQLLVKRNEALEDELADHKQIALLAKAKAEADRNREVVAKLTETLKEFTPAIATGDRAWDMNSLCELNKHQSQSLKEAEYIINFYRIDGPDGQIVLFAKKWLEKYGEKN